MDFLTQFKSLFEKDATARVFFTQDAKFALADVAADKPTTLTGYALLWGVVSTDRGGYKVRLLPGSARVTSNALALFSHDTKLIIGASENGTLRYSSDDVGLKVEIDLPDTTTGNDVATLVGDRYVKGMSFGMLLDPSPVIEAKVENGQNVLEISDFVLDEVTVLARPAFSQTSIDIKADVSLPDAEFARKQSARLEQVRLDRVRLDRLKVSMLGA
jgi:HK97 family phage prohead protease